VAQTAQGDDGYIRDLVKQGDQDRYWAGLLAAEPVRADLFALYAFNLELARIPDQVSEPQLGEIRLQWWSDTLAAALQGELADHPVVAGLTRAALKHHLPQEALFGMIDARRFDLYDNLMPDFAALEAYLAATAGAQFSLAACILGATGEVTEPLSRNAALAYGLTGLMRALPYHAARGRIFLPQSLLAAHGLHPSTLLSGNDNEDLRAGLRDTVYRASEALTAFRPLASALPRRIRPAYLPVRLVAPYLKRLNNPGYQPFRDAVELNPLQRYGLIWQAYLRGRF
jgi:phytoene synthase